MNNQLFMCKNCGYYSTKKFDEDICPVCGLTDWKCGICGYTITSTLPVKICPECEARHFENLTSYIPDWNPVEHVNSHL